MKQCVPDWSMEDEMRSFHDLLPCSNQKKPMSPENDLVELLWRNGHVVMQSQSNRKPTKLNTNEFKHTTTLQKPTVPLVNPSSLIQEEEEEEEEEEAAAWFQYTLDDGSLDKEFCSELLFCDMPIANATNYDTCNKPNKEVARVAAANQHSNNAFMMVAPPPPPPLKLGNGGGGPLNFSHFSRPMKKPGVVVGESSSACGTNQAVQNQVAYVKNQTLSNEATGLLVGNKLGKDGGNNQVISLQEGVRTSTFDATTMTSSSGGSGCSFGRTTGQQSTSNHNDKRKGRDAEDSECPSEEAEYESVEANRPTKRAASTRKSRAAEVHNLSERRRRDRINEKMKALQELIPHCNKSDKASMLDEAIEYLKSLQLQLQLMWMGSGMAPMMFPGMQQCMSRVNVGMGHAPMTSINNPIQLSRAPLINHSLPSTTPTNQMTMCPPSQTANPISLTPQMQNVPHPESYARYFGFPHMQMPPQTMNLYTYGSHMMTQNQTGAMPGSSSLPTAGIPPENIQNGQSG